jgi:hypothetical protein
MGLLKTALIGAAIYGAFKYLTKKDELTGRSTLDDLKDQAPEWIEKLKGYSDELSTKMNNPTGRYSE